MSSDILFLSHRIPYPPNKGDKIRSYHILRHLAERHRVHLCAFVDDPDDWQYADAVGKLCASVKLVKLNRRVALLRSAFSLFRGEALGLGFYRDAEFAAWVSGLQKRVKLDGVFVYSSTMAQYSTSTPGVRVLDLCDVDSEKWRQYAERHRFPLNLIYRREARLLAKAERDFAKGYQYITLVSESEADLFRKLAPEAAPRIYALRNGVDTEYFDPSQEASKPFAGDEVAVVFTGAMDYWANVDAVQWFVSEIWPAIVRAYPAARFYIVGSRPGPDVRALAAQNVVVTGTVPDVRPYLHHATAVVAPLRVARGVQNKVLEALAMARPVIATSDALDGLAAIDESGAFRADSVSDFVERLNDVLRSAVAGQNRRVGRDYVVRRFGWSASLDKLTELFSNAPLLARRGS